jgi:hypothetical protein
MHDYETEYSYEIATRPRSTAKVDKARKQTTIWFALLVISSVIFAGSAFTWSSDGR